MVVVNIEEGKILGKETTGFTGNKFLSFQGIPYAKPPLGELRFKAPKPIEKWSGIKDCTIEGPTSIQRDLIDNKLQGSEDCLVLNVFTKSLNPSTKKPVMVWIHGGGFLNGSSFLYGPDFLMAKDIVFVSINYRVGVLGFLSLEDDTLGVPGNAGLKDQVMALQWVRRNIHNFGGDANNVTIFGESAGAASVHFHVLSPMAKGLFHKAIVQSGSALNCWSLAEFPLIKFLEALKCPFKDNQKILKFLQEVPADEIIKCQDIIGDHLDINSSRYYGLVIEKCSQIEPNFLTQHPKDIIKNGTYNKVPMIFGYTSREGIFSYYVPKHLFNGGIKNFEDAIPLTFDVQPGTTKSIEIAKKIKTFYYGNEEPSKENIEKFILLHGDTFFIHSIQQSAKLHSKQSNESIYLYRFSFDGNRNVYKNYAGIKIKGASHFDDMAYLFHMNYPEFLNNNQIITNSLEEITIRRMIELWTNFASNGDPNPLEKSDFINVNWTPLTGETTNYIDIGSTLATGIEPDHERMKFWDEIKDFCLNENSK